MISYKQAAETLDFTLDWTDWLAGDRISTAIWTVPAGITKTSDNSTITTTTVWLSGGTAGVTYELSVLITTAGGRTSARSLTVRIYPATILTPDEAANMLRCEVTDALMLDLLPQIDAEIFRATGRKWEDDSVICPEAKAPALDLLVCLHEGGWPSEGLHQHYLAGLTRLEALAQYYFTFEGLDGVGAINLHHVHEGDTVVSVIGRVGITGSQSAKFEGVISDDHYLQQISSDDLEDKWYTAYIVPPSEI